MTGASGGLRRDEAEDVEHVREVGGGGGEDAEDAEEDLRVERQGAGPGDEEGVEGGEEELGRPAEAEHCEKQREQETRGRWRREAAEER
nr:unnamed protein product [Digitaria exilis]